jgi:3-oxoacyl-[acyl-carrier-protein] synthase II
MAPPRVVVTGLGVVSSIGIGSRPYWEAMLAGRSGVGPIRYVDTTDSLTQFGGEVREFESGRFMPDAVARRLGRGTQFAVAATRLALEDAGLPVPSTDASAAPSTTFDGRRTGVCLGTTMADIQALETIDAAWVAGGERGIPSRLIPQYPSCSMSANVAKHFGFLGPNLMIPTACAAGNYAIARAFDLLRLGRADVMVAGGAEPFSRIIFTGFNRLLAIAPERCQPFDRHRKGLIAGEGAGILVLEREADARARGAHIHAEIRGYGMSCDGGHMTIPNVDGLTQVLRDALDRAEIAPGDVDYVSAHGTGTPANDRAECAAIRNALGGRTDHVPVSSIKSMIGHTMGAASALEAVVCALVVQRGQLPPTMNFETPDPECAVDCVPNASRPHRTEVALNNSFAFGGNNACVVVGAYL